MSVGFIGGKFLPLHQGHVFAIAKASSMVDRLYVILSHSEKRDRELCGRDGCRYIPPQVRLGWLKKLSNDHVIPLAVEDSFSDSDYDWEKGSELIKDAIGEKVDIIFGSEPEYGKIFKKNYPQAEYVLIDSERKRFPVSATEVRKNPLKNWDMLPDYVKPFFVKKVVVVGTESCGKSTLVKNLASIYNTSYVGEYGRYVCEEVGGPECLTDKDYHSILYGHKLLEDEACNKSRKLVIIDTEAIVTKYYAKLYNDYDNPLFDAIASQQDYDLWLYLEPDVSWVDDGQRRHGDDRVRKDNDISLKQMLDKKGINYTVIRGSYEKRLAGAIDAVDALLSE